MALHSKSLAWMSLHLRRLGDQLPGADFLKLYEGVFEASEGESPSGSDRLQRVCCC